MSAKINKIGYNKYLVHDDELPLSNVKEELAIVFKDNFIYKLGSSKAIDEKIEQIKDKLRLK